MSTLLCVVLFYQSLIVVRQINKMQSKERCQHGHRFRDQNTLVLTLLVKWIGKDLLLFDGINMLAGKNQLSHHVRVQRGCRLNRIVDIFRFSILIFQ